VDGWVGAWVVGWLGAWVGGWEGGWDGGRVSVRACACACVSGVGVLVRAHVQLVDYPPYKHRPSRIHTNVCVNTY